MEQADADAGRTWMKDDLCRVLARRYRLSEETVRALVKDVFAWAHETAFKESPFQAVFQAYGNFGEDICWHLFGLLMEAYRDEKYCHDAEQDLLTAMQYFNTALLKKNRPIMEKWEIEKQQAEEENK